MVGRPVNKANEKSLILQCTCSYKIQTGAISAWVSLLSRRFMSPCHMTRRGGGVRAQAHLCINEGEGKMPQNRNEDAANWNFAWKLQPVMSDFQPQTTYRTVKFIFALEDRGCCGISTEFATKLDGVALMPTSHDCEDDECVDGSAISPAIVYVHGLRTFKYLRMNTD